MAKTVHEVMNELNEKNIQSQKKRASAELKLLAKADWTGVSELILPKVILEGVVEHIYRLEEELASLKKQQKTTKTVNEVKNSYTISKAGKRKFKAGDIVKLKSAKHNTTYKVVGYCKNDSHRISLRGVDLLVEKPDNTGFWSKHGEKCWNSEDGLELVQPKPKFQIGDRVCSIRDRSYRYIITGPKDKGLYPVRPNSHCAASIFKYENLIERIPLSEFTFRDLQVGDIIKYNGLKWTVKSKDDVFETFFASNDKSTGCFSSADITNGRVKVVDTPQ